ncbi:MAG: type VI secretion system baseplate subunit TssK [Chitinispirillaceae bacterium]|nr:type VI secretion system baseplate subunit TssK [Chitinispirillaceae bacterium]
MKPMKPLFWHQGLFLQPQHFQQLDLFAASLTGPLQSYGTPWFWGVMHLSFDDEQLKNGIAAISEGEFLFSDGTWVAFPENAVILSRTLDRELFEPHKPFLIYAALRRFSRSKANVEMQQNPEQLNQSGSRFVADTSSTESIDLHEGSEPGNVLKLNYVVKLFFEGEKHLLADYSILPIARIEYDGERFVRYADYAPPALTLATSPVLLRSAKTIADQLLGASRRLDQYKIPRENITAQYGGAYYIYMLGLLILNRNIPMLYHFLSSPSCHPFEFYGLLRQVIGELSSFTDRHGCLADLPDGTRLLGDYDHTDISRCYNQAGELISALIRSLITGPDNTIAFNLDADGGYSAVIPLNAFENAAYFFLLIRTSEKLERILSSINDSIKIGNRETISDLVSRSLPGLPIEYVQVPPPGIPRRNDTHCFRIDPLHEQWNEIKKSRTICIFWNRPPADISFELVVIRS